MMLTEEQRKQFSEIFQTLGETLDITEAQYNAAVKSYCAVGEWLAKPESTLAPYMPVIRPQGSFMLGTMIRPICEEDDLDIDLVCELTGKDKRWTQYNLKQFVGQRLANNETYRQMLKQEGRRCWTLQYADGVNYHMDILPSIVSKDYKIILEKAAEDSFHNKGYDSLAIRITDKKEANYRTEPNSDNWLKSNPFAYGIWFYNIANAQMRKSMMFSAEVKPVPKYNQNKTTLQRVVQILKRHRDVMFNGDEDKPISIIITTLAAKAYNSETSLIEALNNVSSRMRHFIEERYNRELGRNIKWISNPVNPEENFADKWVEQPQRETKFYQWLGQLEHDMRLIVQSQGNHHIAEAMKKQFGERTVVETFTTFGKRAHQSRENGDLKMVTNTGILSTTGTIPIQPHNFHGK